LQVAEGIYAIGPELKVGELAPVFPEENAALSLVSWVIGSCKRIMSRLGVAIAKYASEYIRTDKHITY
jgi:hypothetical protein